MKAFLLYSDPIGDENGLGRDSTVHITVKAAVDHACRLGGRIFQPPGEEDFWRAPVRRAVETNTLLGRRYFDFVVVRDGKTDVVAIRECEVML